MGKLRPQEYGQPWKLSRGANLEACNTIIERIHESGLYFIDALTAEGWLRTFAFEFSEHDREKLVQDFHRWMWYSPRADVLISGRSAGASEPRPIAAHYDYESGIVDAPRNDWVFSASEILARLESRDTSAEDRLTAVLFAETTAFVEAQNSRLLKALFDFCIEHRFSKDDEVLTAVGSAIRKYAMNMAPADFESYAQLFSTTATDTLSCDVELELAKSIVWRLATLSHVESGAFPILESRLSELASDYLIPRLILQENYASIVLQAIAAVCLLSGSRKEELIDRIVDLKIAWFLELFARRITEIANRTRAPELRAELLRVIADHILISGT